MITKEEVGKRQRYCDEGRIEIDLELKRIKGIKVFGKAKDFKRKKQEKNNYEGY